MYLYINDEYKVSKIFDINIIIYLIGWNCAYEFNDSDLMLSMN